jgi:AcrR family transcriptional regulator
MEEICAELGISKKTIYKSYSSKEELVDKVVENELSKRVEEINFAKNNSIHAIDELVKIYTIHLESLKNISPVFFTELQKGFKSSWDKLSSHINENAKKVTEENLIRGQEEGLYRRDIDIEFIAHIHVNSIFGTIEFFSNQSDVSFNAYNKQCLFYHVNGIGTQRGIEIFNNLNLK